MSVVRRKTALPDSVRTSRWTLLLLASMFTGACVAPPPTDPSEVGVEAPVDFPFAVYQQALTDGKAVYEISSNDSLVRVFAYRAGALSRMGHDHVISSRAVKGFSQTIPNAVGSGVTVQADLYMPLALLRVDDEQLRAEAGFDSAVSERARAGTRSNMLISLGAPEYPHVFLHIEASIEHPDIVATEIPLRVGVTLHGVTNSFDVPATVAIDSTSWHAVGHFSLRQTDFGIKPHSALGGALAVRDELRIDFDLNAIRLPLS